MSGSQQLVAARISDSRTASRRGFLRRVLIGGLAAGAVLGGGVLAYTGFLSKPSPGGLTSSSAFSVQASSSLKTGGMSVEEAIAQRRSVRTYKKQALKAADVSQMLWAAQGITDAVNGLRSAPSAGGLYPLEIYVVIASGGVEELSAGVYHYDPTAGTLKMFKGGDYLQKLQSAALDQPAVGSSPVSFVICGVFERTTVKYGQRGVQYVFQESGHAAQNMYLQAVALRLGMVVIGAFSESEVASVIGSKSEETPLYIVPLGLPD